VGFFKCYDDAEAGPLLSTARKLGFVPWNDEEITGYCLEVKNTYNNSAGNNSGSDRFVCMKLISLSDYKLCVEKT
jgi:hypothetical protein